jgi:hypothetical protein
MLGAPELGPAAYSAHLYPAAFDIWPLPVGKRILLALVVLIALSMVPSSPWRWISVTPSRRS